MNQPKHLLKIGLLLITLTAILTLTQTQPNNLAAQSSSDETIIEDFSNGFFPPRLNNFFNHTFTLGTAWDLTGVGIGDPISQSAPFALRLYAGNEDRITFNNFGRAYVTEAEIWSYADATDDGETFGRGQVVFEGRGDSKTFQFTGLVPRWQQFLVTEATLGDNGTALGEIVAIRLTDLANNGYSPLFDDLRVISRTPPRTADLSLTLTGPASPVNPGNDITYGLELTNNGPDPAVDALIESVLPFGATFLPTRSDPRCREENGGVILCRLGTIPVNGQRTANLAVTVSDDICRTLSLRSVASAFALDHNPSDNTAVFNNTTPNPACADLTVTHHATPLPPEAGQPFAYQITVHNNGSETTSATLTHSWPSLLGYLPTLSSPNCQSEGGEIVCNIAALPPYRSQTVELIFHPTLNLVGLVESETAVTGAVFDPQPDNNRHTYRFSIGPRYNYTIMATAGEGALANFDSFLSLDLNSQGNVAFAAWQEFNPTNFGVYLADGETLTTIATPELLPPLANGLEYRINNDEIVTLNDVDEVAFSIDTHEREEPHAQTASAIVLGDGDSLTLPVTRTVSTDGTGSARTFNLPILLQNNGEMTTAFRRTFNGSSSEKAEIVTYDEAGEVIFGHILDDLDDNVLAIGRSYNGLVYEQRDGDAFLQSQLNIFYRLGGAHGTLRRFNNTIGIFSDRIPFNDRGYTLFHQRLDDTQAVIAREIIYGGYGSASQELAAFLTGIGYSGRIVGDPAVNNKDEFAFSCFSPFCKSGIYTGQPAPETAVVQSTTYPIDGSLVATFLGYYPHSLDINDRGQIAFVATLQDGREVLVRADPTRDNDEDGRSDVEESRGPRNGDGNFDGINDGTQPHVATFPNAENGGYITFETNDQQRLQNVINIDNPDPDTAPAHVTFPIGHFQFEVTELEPGAATTVTIYTNRVIQSWWKYGPTPSNPTPHWYEFTYDGQTGAQLLAGRVVLHFVDGERGDSDLTANGVILDPGAPSGFPHSLYLPFINR